MGDTYSCNFANCDKVFTKAYELKKHKATHEDPASVFHCSECDFITLQKKSLAIHFAKHTGEKTHQCPETINSSGPPAREVRCDYRTNDPAALSRHRKKVHGYVPSSSRSRPTKVAPGKPQQNVDNNVTRRAQRSQRPDPASRRNLSCAPPKANNIPGYPSSSAEMPCVDGDAMDIDCHYDFSGATLVDSDEEMELDSPYDPSLRSHWMAEYEDGYSTFGTTELKYRPEPAHAVPPSALTSLDARTGREGCLCPEWMVEAGIWNQSTLEPPREYYVLDA